MHRLHSAPRRVALGLHGQIAGHAGYRKDAHLRRIDPPDSHPIADRLDRVPENIEADGDISNRRRRKRGHIVIAGFLRHGRR